MTYAGTALAGAVSMIAILKAIRSEPTDIRVPDQPIRTRQEDKLVTAEMCATSQHETQRRLSEHDHQIQMLWSTVRDENNAIRSEMRKGFADQERSLGRIEGALGKLETKL